MQYPLRICVVLVIIYVLIVVVLYWQQRSLMYFPNGTLTAPHRAGLPGMSTVTLKTSDDLDLSAWYMPPADNKPVIVVFHGNAGILPDRAFKFPKYLTAGYGLLLVEYRGYGGNPGIPTEAGFYLDGEAALKFLDERGISSDRLVLYGESLGTGVVIELAQNRPLGGIVLEAPYSSIVDVAVHHYWYFPVRWLIKDRFDSLAKAANIQAPVFIIHGGRDKVIPVELGRKLFAALAEPKQAAWIPDAGHNNLYEYGAERHILRFLAGFAD